METLISFHNCFFFELIGFWVGVRDEGFELHTEYKKESDRFNEVFSFWKVSCGQREILKASES